MSARLGGVAGLAAGLVALSLGLAACTEKPQTAGTRQVDTPAYLGAQDPYVAAGWKPGDPASWDQQLTTRAQSQNEYKRIGSQ